MKKISTCSIIRAAATTMLMHVSAHAASTNIAVSADGDAQTFGGNDVNTTDTVVTTTQSGSLQRHIILEFDLSPIPDGSTIDSVTLNLTKSGGFSNTGGNPIPLHLLAYTGDGVIDIADYSAAGTDVGNPTIAITPTNPVNGTAYAYGFTTVAPAQTALDTASNLLTVRIETDSFATANFTSSESTSGFAAPSLDINYTLVPEPSSTAMMALAGFIGLSRRRRL